MSDENIMLDQQSETEERPFETGSESEPETTPYTRFQQVNEEKKRLEKRSQFLEQLVTTQQQNQMPFEASPEPEPEVGFEDLFVNRTTLEQVIDKKIKPINQYLENANIQQVAVQRQMVAQKFLDENPELKNNEAAKTTIDGVVYSKTQTDPYFANLSYYEQLQEATRIFKESITPFVDTTKPSMPQTDFQQGATPSTSRSADKNVKDYERMTREDFLKEDREMRRKLGLR